MLTASVLAGKNDITPARRAMYRFLMMKFEEGLAPIRPDVEGEGSTGDSALYVATGCNTPVKVTDDGVSAVISV